MKGELCTLVIALGIYISGVVVAVVLIAWYNAIHKDDECPVLAVGLSWVAALMLFMVLLTMGLVKFYDWTYNKFSKKLKVD